MEYISITNDPRVAQYFEQCGIDNIMVDLEVLGKEERQKGLNTVKSHHSINDISKVKNVLTKSQCLVRVNPIHEGSKEEISEAIVQGADILMLPMFKTKEEVSYFVDLISGRAKVYLLLETTQALTRIDDILTVAGIDAIHIGLNDLSIGLGLDFLYEPVIGGLVEYMGRKIKATGIKFGFGGVSRIELSRNLLSEHYRMGSEMVILNRHFRNYKDKYEEIVLESNLKEEVEKVDCFFSSLSEASEVDLLCNKLLLDKEIKAQITRIKSE